MRNRHSARSGDSAALVEVRAMSVLAWALLPNHARLLVRTGRGPLTGYAGAFDVHRVCE